MRTHATTVAAALALFAVAAACAPTTKYRREALVPSPQAPPYRGEPVGKRHLEIQVQLSGSHVEEEELPEVGDDALWVPEFMIDAAGMIGVIDGLDVGFLFSYAHGSWAERSAHGTPPMPGDGKHVFSIGPQLGGGARLLGGKLFVGAYGSLQYVRIPWSEWELTNPDDVTGSACYRMKTRGNENDIMYKFGVFLGGRPSKWVALHAGLAVQSAWTNIGFSNREHKGSTLSQTVPLLMPLVGLRIDVRPIFFEGTLTFPVSLDREVEYFPLGWSGAVGFRL